MFEIPYRSKSYVTKLLSKGPFSPLYAALDQMSMPFNILPCLISDSKVE